MPTTQVTAKELIARFWLIKGAEWCAQKLEKAWDKDTLRCYFFSWAEVTAKEKVARFWLIKGSEWCAQKLEKAWDKDTLRCYFYSWAEGAGLRSFFRWKVHWLQLQSMSWS